MEQWKTIQNFEEYEVSNGGRIRNTVTGTIRKCQVSPHGYIQVVLRNSSQTPLKLHRVVAEAFLDNPDNLPIVMHLDGNKKNNHVSNLKWGTYSENLIQAYRTGERTPAKLEGKWEEIVTKYKAKQNVRGTIANLAREYKCDRKAIYQVLSKNGLNFK